MCGYGRAIQTALAFLNQNIYSVQTKAWIEGPYSCIRDLHELGIVILVTNGMGITVQLSYLGTLIKQQDFLDTKNR